MTNTEKWNRIVECYEKNKNAMENVIETTWENIFVDYLNYRRLEGDIDRQRKIPIGSTQRPTADIIIKDGDRDLFVVELKRHSLPFNTEMESQLLSYLKLLRNKTGILICDKIYIYMYDINKRDDEQNKMEINFTRDNADGIAFVELFSKANFNEMAIHQFVQDKIKSVANIELIKNEITPALITKLLQNHFIERYNMTEIEEAINTMHVQNNKKITTEEGSHRISRAQAKQICISNGIPIAEPWNYANRNDDRDYYAIDPQIERLTQNWWMLLIDPVDKEINVFNIPIGALPREKIKFRDKGAKTFLLRFKIGDISFEDTLSNIKFKPWLVKTIKI